MTKKEKQIYKSGKRNPNGYIDNPFDFFGRRKRLAILVCILIAISFIYEIFCLSGLTNWHKLFYSLNLVESVKQEDSDFIIYYLDAGQGDCSIVICDDEVMMIDTSTSKQFYNIRSNLFMLDIDKIDYLVISHPHDDHMGSASDIISHYDVSNIIMPKILKSNMDDSFVYENIIKSIVDYCVTPVAAAYGDYFMLGSAKVEILSPIKQDKNINNMSLTLKITYGSTSFLFMGDNEKEIEKSLLRNNVDISANVLKIGHHGSNTSSTDEFLSTVNPDYTIISSGVANIYGHPTDSVVERLQNRGTIPYVTSLNGHITVTSDGDNINVTTVK